MGLFAEIEPRLFPEEIVAHEILTGRGVVHLGVFCCCSMLQQDCAHSPVLCPVVVFTVLFFSLILFKKINVPCTRWYVVACAGYVDRVM